MQGHPGPTPIIRHTMVHPWEDGLGETLPPLQGEEAGLQSCEEQLQDVAGPRGPGEGPGEGAFGFTGLPVSLP